MSYDPIGGPARRQRRRQKLGAEARCLGCGIANPDVLRLGHRSLLEQHHVLGAAHAPALTVPVCLNCHAILSAHQRNEGMPMELQSTVLERIQACLDGFVAFLKGLAEFVLALLMSLGRFIKGLDAHGPTWRDQSWAR